VFIVEVRASAKHHACTALMASSALGKDAIFLNDNQSHFQLINQ
jgi:hypothetical protein